MEFIFGFWFFMLSVKHNFHFFFMTNRSVSVYVYVLISTIILDSKEVNKVHIFLLIMIGGRGEIFSLKQNSVF